jgi:signal transduction histidine kinase
MTQSQINNVSAFNQFDRWLYEHQGSGLGLIIVKRMIDIYEGKLEIDSAPGEGTTVTIMLPIVQ